MDTNAPASSANDGLNGLNQMGIHPLSLNGLMGKVNPAINTLYEQITTFSIQYGGMVLVIAAVIWLIAWKLHWSSAATWCKRLISGVFFGEAIVILLPQLFYSFVAFLNRL